MLKNGKETAQEEDITLFRMLADTAGLCFVKMVNVSGGSCRGRFGLCRRRLLLVSEPEREI